MGKIHTKRKLAVARQVMGLFHQYGLLDEIAELARRQDYIVEPDFSKKLLMKLALIDEKKPAARKRVRVLTEWTRNI